MSIFEIPSRGSFKRQIILTFVVGFFFLIAAFSIYLVTTEKDNLHRDSVNETTSMAQSLAASALSWVLANDVSGLQEVVHASHAYPEFSYAMVLSPTGRVLAHSDTTKVGLSVTDEQSLALLKSTPGNRVMVDNESTIDVAVPIEINNRHVGWVRVGSEQKENTDNLRKMIWSNIFFLLFATALSFIAALLIANRLGRRIGSLVQVAEDVQVGNFSSRVSITHGGDEITKLGDSLNQMLNALAQAEQELRAVSRYTRSLIEASLDPLVTISAEGKITDVNRATEKATGRNRAELIGTDFSDYFTEPDKAREGYQRVFQQGFVTDYPLSIRHGDGHITDVLYNASIYRDEAGEAQGVFAAARDITERKRAEDALRNSENRYRLLVESSPMCIHEIGMDGRISSMNKAGLVMMGIAKECKIQGFLYLDAVCDADRERIAELLAKAYAGEASYFEFKASGPDGRIFKSCFVPIKNQNGGIEKLMGITEDITERIQAENEIRELNHDLERRVQERTEELRESEERFRSVASNTPDHLIVQDRELRYTLVINPQLGLTEQDMLGKTDRDFLTGEEADKLIKVKRQVLDTGMPIHFETSLTSLSGEEEFFDGTYVPKFNANGDVDGLIGYFKNVTERKRFEENIRRLNDELRQHAGALEAANKELEAFSYSVSHDLRAPLRAIDGFSHILLDDYAGKLDDEGKRLLNVVRDNAGKMGQLIDDILKFSRAGRLEITFSEIDMERMAREVFEEFRPAAGHEVQVEIGRIPAAKGDRAMMRQVFVNLLSNAIKFTRSREGGRIEVGSSSGENETVYFVKDNGAGFDMQYVDRLFGVFQRLHAVNEFEGTGIGLAIVKRIVTRHGGRVWAEGKVNGGATIYFALPVMDAALGSTPC